MCRQWCKKTSPPFALWMGIRIISQGLALMEELPKVSIHNLSLLMGFRPRHSCRELVTYDNWLPLSKSILIGSYLVSPMGIAWAVCKRSIPLTMAVLLKLVVPEMLTELVVHVVLSEWDGSVVLCIGGACSEIDWWWHLWQCLQVLWLLQFLDLCLLFKQLKQRPALKSMSLRSLTLVTMVQAAE